MSNLKYKPLNGHVVIKEKSGPEKTDSGIFIPENTEKKVKEGEVIAISEDLSDKPIKVGDTVLLNKYASKTQSPSDDGYTFLLYKDLMAVCEA